VRIGRQDDSGVMLTDQTVSRRHSILEIQRHGPCVLRD
jgi:pSer/pThr/pTyr-binding forkhead associated (FHA) protein